MAIPAENMESSQIPCQTVSWFPATMSIDPRIGPIQGVQPATKAMPKELLPIVNKPLIQYAAEEAIAAGIDTLIFVTGRNKRAIEDHFDNNQSW